MDGRDLSLLADIARCGSLTGAARRCGVAVSTVTRRLDALERETGFRLADRRDDGATLTAKGQRLLDLGEPVLEGLARLRRAAQALRGGGEREAVVISATEFVVSEVLAPALPRLCESRPGLMVTLRSDAQIVSLAHRDADIAIRMARPEGDSLYARKLPEVALGLFASPAYLGDRDPASLDLRAERLLVYDDSYGPLAELSFVKRLGLEGAVTLRTGSTRALLAAAEAGGGVALLPRVFALRAGLIETPSPLSLGARAPWIVSHRDLRAAPQVRAAREWVTHAFSSLKGR